MSEYLPYGRQTVDEDDVRAVVKVLRSAFLTQGPVSGEFEKAVAAYCGAQYAVAVSSGTAALHLAAMASGLGPGDRLWTSPNTFVASANCALYCGATPDFVDIEAETGLMSVSALEASLARAEIEGRLPKVVIPVHFAGQSCDMAPIRRLADRHGFTVIEDACHALGGSYQGRKVGGCELSEMAVFSFHPVKSITTAEGGMILTNKRELYEKILRLRSHGITRDDSQMQDPSEGPWFYQQMELGMNYRMSDMQAALGVSQLRRLDKFVARRKQRALQYNDSLAALPLRPLETSSRCESAHHLYVVRLRLDEMPTNRRELFTAMLDRGIGVNVHYIPVHLQPVYRRLGFSPGQYPQAEQYYREAMTLPLYPGMTDAQHEKVAAALSSVLG